jgi:hypothetical protein
MVMVWFEVPRVREFGLSEVIVGRAFTVNALAREPTPPSRLVTVTVLAPTVAVAEIVTLAVSCVALLRVTELTVMPVPENATDVVGQVPLAKFVPVMTMLWLVAPWPRELGLSEVMVGAALTVNPLARVARPPSMLTTVTVLAPTVAVAEIVTLAVSCVVLLRVTELTVIPVPENRTEEAAQVPVRKFVPVMVMFWLAAPWPREAGLSDEMVGAAATVRQPVHVRLAEPWVTVTFRAPVPTPVVMVTKPFRWVASR